MICERTNQSRAGLNKHKAKANVAAKSSQLMDLDDEHVHAGDFMTFADWSECFGPFGNRAKVVDTKIRPEGNVPNMGGASFVNADRATQTPSRAHFHASTKLPAANIKPSHPSTLQKPVASDAGADLLYASKLPDHRSPASPQIDLALAVAPPDTHFSPTTSTASTDGIDSSEDSHGSDAMADSINPKGSADLTIIFLQPANFPSLAVGATEGSPVKDKFMTSVKCAMCQGGYPTQARLVLHHEAVHATRDEIKAILKKHGDDVIKENEALKAYIVQMQAQMGPSVARMELCQQLSYKQAKELKKISKLFKKMPTNGVAKRDAASTRRINARLARMNQDDDDASSVGSVDDLSPINSVFANKYDTITDHAGVLHRAPLNFASVPTANIQRPNVANNAAFTNTAGPFAFNGYLETTDMNMGMNAMVEGFTNPRNNGLPPISAMFDDDAFTGNQAFGHGN